jgi:hypothetical protein
VSDVDAGYTNVPPTFPTPPISGAAAQRTNLGFPQDGRVEGAEQVLPAGLRPVEDPAAETAQEPADQGAHDASYEHPMCHLRDLHLQGDQVQLAEGGRRRRGTHVPAAVPRPNHLFCDPNFLFA